MTEQPWLFIPASAGTRAYAEAVQAMIGGVVRETRGWFWVDLVTEEES